MFMAAAHTLAREVGEDDLEHGRIYPPLTRIRAVSATIATAVAEIAYLQGLAAEPRPPDLRARIESLMYRPAYEDYLAPPA
jgi:malate dehydrogenase (oxaloacetate-decarboxylating)(NADP+)